MRRRPCSWSQITFQHFAGDVVFQTPMTVVARTPMPIRRGRTVTDTTQELQPGQLRRRFARTGPGFAFCDKLNSPRVGGGLSHDQWQWCLGKLEECASVGVSGDEQFSRDFRRILPRSPDGLATLNAPAGLSEIYCRKRRHRATRTQRVKRKRDGEKQNKIPLRERNLFVHGPADRTCFTKLHGNQARNFCAASAGGSLALRPSRVRSARFHMSRTSLRRRTLFV